MTNTPGTQGYDRFIGGFIETSQSLNFEDVCKDFVDFLPSVPGRVLDAGAGAGQNAAALAELGYRVTAVEPMAEFLHAARTQYKELPITWLNGSLPNLECLEADQKHFDLILVIAVWHHLSEKEQGLALQRIEALLAPGGVCALSLRNGPAGLGTQVYPTSANHTLEHAKELGLECLFHSEEQPSMLANKPEVKWARLVLKKPAEFAEARRLA